MPPMPEPQITPALSLLIFSITKPESENAWLATTTANWQNLSNFLASFLSIKSVGTNRTVFLSTHIMQEVEAICDRVIIINKGQIVADKKLADLRDSEEQTVVVEFDYRVEDVFLLKLPQAKQVKNTHDFVYEITFATSQDMRSHVFDFAHDNQLKILQLNQKHASLENLFRELTSEA